MLLFVVAFFNSPKPSSEPKPIPQSASPPPEAPKPVAEPTPEQKAEQAANKAREDEEDKKFARDVAAVRRLKSAMITRNLST